MNDSIKRISLDIHSTSSGETVNAKRGDTARKLIISLVDGGLPYNIGEDCSAVFIGKKPDRNVLFNDCIIKEDCTINGNTIIYQFTDQTTAAEGRVNCEIQIYGADDKLITSPKFTINVFGTVYNEGDKVESSDEFNALTRLIADTQKAVKEAQEAIEDAQEAIKMAQEMEASLLITDASGSPIAIDNAAEHSLIGLRIFGKTTQDGTPTPDAPIDLVSVGDSGSITVNVNDAQSMTIAMPNGLPGITVTSGGNYTDSNGQQWICDEKDFARGVYVKRVQRITFDQINDVTRDEIPIGSGFYRFNMAANSKNPVVNTAFSSLNLGLSNVFRFYYSVLGSNTRDNCIATYNKGGLYARCDSIATAEEFLTTARKENWEVLSVLETPIETPLSEEELAAYAALHTYRNNTTVSNDAGAWMELEYVMDAKKYIDSLVISGGAAPSRIANVTILASAWKTEAESLYSQVVTIKGVTPYSKVDLLPSVEQLAIFHNKDVAFVTENEDGVVTVFAIGDKPTQNYTMQAQITEVQA